MDTARAGSESDTAAAVPVYDEVIVSQGVRIPFIRGPITRRIAMPLRRGDYAADEAEALRSLLRPGDRVLELGAGFGFLSAVAATEPGVELAAAVEANPAFLPVLAETLRLNGAGDTPILHGAVTAEGSAPGTVPFYLRRVQLASSANGQTQGFSDEIEVPALGLPELIAAHRPTVILCDIAGAEEALFETADLSGVRAVLVRTHPRLYRGAGLAGVERALTSRGLLRQPGTAGRTELRLFARAEARVDRDGKAWPPEAPRVLIGTCMKNEGPFILEWIAWHRAIGVTDFVVFTNDCNDGSDLLLDQLDRMGLIRHLPNPAIASDSSYFQPAALKYLPHLRTFREAEFVISMDVDEFINIRVGAGRLADLFAVTGPFDVLSMFEINHGANQREHYERGWLKDLFPRHQSDRPGRNKASRGVKSIVRQGPRIAAVRNHRPDVTQDADVIWLNGSGVPMPSLRADSSLNGGDCRDGYDLVSLDHFALRSLGSYLAKMDRGDVVIEGKKVSQFYWRARNSNEMVGSTFERADAAARAEYARLMQDETLARLHEACCAAHETRIARLLDLPEYQERRDWILREAW